MPVSIRPSVGADCFTLAPRLRKEDVQEIKAHSGRSPFEALTNALRSSISQTIVDHAGRPLGMCGVAPVTVEAGCAWALFTDDIYHHQRPALRLARRWIGEANSRWSLLFNFVDERNTAHVRWLEWLGCTFIARHAAFGIERRPFLEFVRINHV